MKVTDAIMNPIVVGKTYGYSQSNNGITTVVTGVVSKTNEETGKATLHQVKERYGAGGLDNDDVFVPKDRARTVYGCILFPIQ